MKMRNGFKYMMVIFCVVACSQVASAEIVLLTDHELEAVRGQVGIVSMGLDVLGNKGMLAVNRLVRNQGDDVRGNGILTLEGVGLTGLINTGSAFTEVVENDGNAVLHCHFENYGVTVDHLKVDAVYAGGDTSGISFGGFEMTGFSMEISGDVTISLHD
ncbi:MAG: hypothetical protein JEZ12_15235 [Desulfobacterium sp.]|nr:hypothetical protein [Desulfobacterium sp.]